MITRSLFVLAVTGLLTACGSETDPAVPTPEPGAADAISGLYKVTGVTVEQESGDEREIAGTVILAQQGDRYTVTFDLTTQFPTPSGPVQSDVIGQGEGSVDGEILEGTAETQIVAASVPGVDSKFAFIPRQVSARIVSTTVSRVYADGSVSIEIESQPVEGQQYAATRTSLKGERIATRAAGALPEVAAPPPE